MTVKCGCRLVLSAAEWAGLSQTTIRRPQMKRFIGLCLLMIVACSIAFAKGHNQQTIARTKTEKEVVASLDALAEAGLKRDVATLDRLYSDDYFHTNTDGSIMTKQQVLAFYKAPPTAITESNGHDEDKVW